MRPPEIEGAMFLAACGLIIDPGSLDEVFERLDWETGRPNLNRALLKLRDRGLVETGIITRRGENGGTVELDGYRLTDDGKRAVVETIDNYLFIAKRFSPAAMDAEENAGSETIDFTPADRHADRPNRDRHPTREELELLLRYAPRELAAPVKVILGCGLSANIVCDLTVGDYDRVTGVLKVPGRVVTLPMELRDLITSAIGSREAGRLFLRPALRNPKPWTSPMPSAKLGTPRVCRATWF